MTTLRAAMIVGKGSAAFETILGLVKRLPVMITPSWVSTPTQPIALDDVAAYLAGVAGRGDLRRGLRRRRPEVMTYRQMIERIARLLDRTPRIVEVPVLTPYLSSLWLELVTPVNASVARPLVEGLRNPTIAREERIRGLLPLELAPFDEAAQQALAEQSRHLGGAVVEDPLDPAPNEQPPDERAERAEEEAVAHVVVDLRPAARRRQTVRVFPELERAAALDVDEAARRLQATISVRQRIGIPKRFSRYRMRAPTPRAAVLDDPEAEPRRGESARDFGRRRRT